MSHNTSQISETSTLTVDPMDSLFDPWPCSHEKFIVQKPPPNFECDACGLFSSTQNPGFTLFKESCLFCNDCGLFVHEKCSKTELSPSLCLYAKSRIEQRASEAKFTKTILPRLKSQHVKLVQKCKTVETEMEALKTTMDASLKTRASFLRDFSDSFYQDIVPEKHSTQFITSLVNLYSKTPTRTRCFFTQLLQAYPAQRDRILTEVSRMESELVTQDLECVEFDRKEASREQLEMERDALFREINFPMDSIANPPYLMRFSVQDTLVIAMGDFFLQTFQASLHVVAGVDAQEAYCMVDISGFNSRFARLSMSMVNFAMFGTQTAISSYSAKSASFEFEFACKIRCDFHGNRWQLDNESTLVTIDNFKHVLQGASFPIPNKIMDWVLHSVFTSQLKLLMLDSLPIELGQYLLKLGKTCTEACDVELCIQIDSKVKAEELQRELSKLEAQEEVDFAHLAQCCIALSPRQTKSEEWTLAKLLLLFNRFYRDKPLEWVQIFHLYGFQPAAQLFDYLANLDAKPCEFVLECVQLKIFVKVNDMLKLAREVLLRVYSTTTSSSLNMRKQRSQRMIVKKESREPLEQSTSQQTRAVIQEVCTQGEQLVHSVLSNAVRELLFTVHFSIKPNEDARFSLSPLRMISSLSTEPWVTPVDWLQQLAKDDEEVKVETQPSATLAMFYSVQDTTGALQVKVKRANEALMISIQELEVKLAFEGEASAVWMKLGYKHRPSIQANGSPRVETTMERASVIGQFSTFFSFLRNSRQTEDEVDRFLQRIQARANAMDILLNVNFQAYATEDSDLNVRICVEHFRVQDEIKLIHLFTDMETFTSV